MCPQAHFTGVSPLLSTHLGLLLLGIECSVHLFGNFCEALSLPCESIARVAQWECASSHVWEVYLDRCIHTHTHTLSQVLSTGFAFCFHFTMSCLSLSTSFFFFFSWASFVSDSGLPKLSPSCLSGALCCHMVFSWADVNLTLPPLWLESKLNRL